MTISVKMKEFWNNTAKTFGGKNDKYGPVLVPSSKGLLNWYIDTLQRTALNQFFPQLFGKTILEVGCGVGRWSIRLARKGTNVIGIDLSREMLKHAKKQISKEKVTNVDLVVASAQNLPFVLEKFDNILSVTVLQHIVNSSEFKLSVSEIIRTVKSGGKIILLEYTNNRFNEYDLQFPTHSYDYEKAFKTEKGLQLTDVQGVDLSIFLRPFNSLMISRGRYRNYLKYNSEPKKNIVLSQIFYFVSSIACICSLPFDMLFRNIFLKYSEHKIFVFKK